MKPEDNQQHQPQSGDVVVPERDSSSRPPMAAEDQTNSADNDSRTADPTATLETRTVEPSAAAVVNGAAVDEKKRQPSRKKLVLISGLALLLVLLTGGYVFGFYIPNKPENLWGTALNRTGEALDSTMKSATEQQNLDAFSKVQMEGNVDLKSKDFSVKGALKGSFDERHSDGSFDLTVKQKDQPERKLTTKFMSDMKEGSQYPSLYLQLSGLRSLGIADLETRIPGIMDYDGKWISIEDSYLKSLTDQMQGGPTAAPETSETKPETPSVKDVADLTRALSGVTKEYVLTAEPSKAIFERRSFVGKETVDGRKMYRYKVGINKENMKAFCKAAADKVFVSAAFKKTFLNGVSAEAQTQQKDAALKDCDKDFDLKDELELWVDTRYKLVHKLRITDKDNKQIHYEIGQNYKGGDDVSLFVAVHNGEVKTDGKLSLHVNLKTNEVKTDLVFKTDGSSGLINFSGDLAVKPLDKNITIEKPADAVPIQSILERYEIDPMQLLYLAQMGAYAPMSPFMTVQPTPAIEQQMILEEPVYAN